MPRTILLILLFFATCFAQAFTTHTDLHVHFAKDKSALDAHAVAQLDSFLTTLTLEGDYAFTVHGHTDSDGSLGYNEALADERSRTVQRYLLDHGADPALITLARSGERDPLATNRTDDGQALNRRVRITFTRHVYADTEELRQALMEGSVQHFTIDPTQEQTVQGTAGVNVRFAAHSLVDAEGRPITTPVTIALTEALALDAMLAHQLSTRSGERLLETAGMLRVEATSATGEPLVLASGSTMEVTVPRTADMPGMELFTSNDGGDWTAVGQPLRTVREPLQWKERPYPNFNWPEFRWPVYSESQMGKPVKPLEPVLRDAPSPPRRESYMAQVPWWSFFWRANAEARAEARYTLAVERHRQQLRKYEVTLADFERQCEAFPEQLARYSERKAAWDEQKRAEQAAWDSTVFQPRLARYNERYGAAIARADSLRRVWQAERTERLERYAQQMDSIGTADAAGLSSYMFATDQLGWINCDRFYDVPVTAKRDLAIAPTKGLDQQVFVVFTELKSLLAAVRVPNGDHVALNVPNAQPKVLFAYAVKDGRAQLCVQEVTPGTKPKLTFRPSTYAEIRRTLQELSGQGS